MARRYFSSIAQRTTLATDVNAGATTIVVAATTGFPASRPYTLVLDVDTVTEEIVEVTAASGTTLTVVRGVDGTSAAAHVTGAVVAHQVTARDLDEPNAHVNASSAVHGLAGSVVGTTDAQTLTNKTISGSANTVSNVSQASVTNLTSDLAAKAALAGATFTGNVNVVSPTAAGSTGVRQITMSTATPTGGSSGDVWLVYV